MNFYERTEADSKEIDRLKSVNKELVFVLQDAVNMLRGETYSRNYIAEYIEQLKEEIKNAHLLNP